MADSKKYDGGQWQHSLRKLTTATEAVENPLYSDGTAITAYTLKGNTVQNGTPTPSNPVEVNGVGVRTENLLSLADVSTQTLNGIEFSVNAQKGTVTINGTAILNQDTAFNIPIDSTLIGDFYVSGCPDGGSMSTYDIYVWDVTSRARCRKWDGTTGMESVLNASQSEEIQLLQGHDNILRIRVRYGIQFDNLEFKPMIRIPTAPSDFEPYGYKIPISSGGVTTNIYLGSTQTVRQIKKVVFDGTEDWNELPSATGKRFSFKLTNAIASDTTIGSNSWCSHLKLVATGATYRNYNCYTITDTSTMVVAIDNQTQLADFKAFLAVQYAAGTPVTVWYVLATPETAAVNEPLMKIGTYADTLSNATAIPTTDGVNSITVDTTVQPSEFTATWTGWHNADVKEKSENLFDKDNNIVNYYLASTNGAYQATSGMSRSIKLKISPSSVYSITLTSYTKRIGFFENEPTDNDVPVAFYNNDTNEYSQSSFTITSPASANYMVIFCYNSSKEYTDGKTINEVMSSVMVNTGSTALPYEPYWK